MSNPLREYQDLRTQRAQERKSEDIAHWQRWKAAPEEHKPAMLQPLLTAYAATFRQKINHWKPPAIVESAFKAELTHHFIEALKDYDPERAALSTHVDMRMKKALRYVGKNQNVAYIPEGQTKHIGQITRAQDQLKEELGRDPTSDEIGDHVGLTGKRVAKIQTSLRRDMPSSLWESDPVAQISSREHQVLGLLRYELDAHEMPVFEHIYGLNGKEKIEDTGALSKTLGLNASQVSRLKSSILQKYNTFK